MSTAKRSDEGAIFKTILERNRQREARSLSVYACKSSDGIRFHPRREHVPDNKNIRSVFFHDTDKIIHSLAYSRYIDKTQVFSFFENDHVTHRVLHVQFVSKIARVIGRALQLNEDLIEAIALAHDIGHPPFGHDGEAMLNKLALKHKAGCFAHNVQSVRFLFEVENRGEGLNISLQVLDGILAHNGEKFQQKLVYDSAKTKKDFLRDYYKASRSVAYARNIVPMTLESCVVRISDIIAYIGRDFEDAIKVGLIKRDQMPRRVKKVLGNHNNQIINTLVTDVIVNSSGKDYISLSKDIFAALKELKDFNYSSIYLNKYIKEENSQKIQRMFKQLFEYYLDDLRPALKKGRLKAGVINDGQFRHFLKGMRAAYFKNNSSARIVVDFISGMTDKFFQAQFNKTVFPKHFGLKLKNK